MYLDFIKGSVKKHQLNKFKPCESLLWAFGDPPWVVDDVGSVALSLPDESSVGDTAVTEVCDVTGGGGTGGGALGSGAPLGAPMLWREEPRWRSADTCPEGRVLAWKWLWISLFLVVQNKYGGRLVTLWDVFHHIRPILYPSFICKVTASGMIQS